MFTWKVIPLGLVVILIAGSVWFTGERLRSRGPGHDPGLVASLPSSAPVGAPSASLDDRGRNVFASYRDLAPRLGRVPMATAARRDLATYYERRAYPGAPPSIPHDVDAEVARDQRCNVCHERGGFVAKWNAYAPVTPHPDYESCQQCHVAGDTPDPLFVATDWDTARPPRLGRAVLPGGPPPIPHTLQLRENCIACHGGASAPLEIRTSHPERENCRQCHVPRSTGTSFERAPEGESRGAPR